MTTTLPTIKIRRTDNPELYSLDFKYSATLANLIRGIPGAQYVSTAKAWAIPTTSLAAALKQLAGVPHQLDPSIQRPPDDVFTVVPSRTASQSIRDAIDNEFVFARAPFVHQRTCMELAVEARIFALLMEMGTGKTKTAIDIVNFWRMRKQIGCVIVFCPKSLLWTWAREIKANTHGDVIVRVIEGDGLEKKVSLQAAKNSADFIIVGYPSLRDEDIENMLTAITWNRKAALIADESSNLANAKSQQYKAAERIGKLSDYKLILNGTPIANGPLDAFGQFKWLNPDILGHHNYTSFKAEYTVMGGFKAKSVVGFKNLDRLQMRIAKHSHRVLKKDCLDIPDKLYRVVEVGMGPKQLEAYRQLRDDSIVEMDGVEVAVPLVITRLMRLQQITSGYLPHVDEFGHEQEPLVFEETKLDAMYELVQSAVAENRKVIVWSRFVRDVKRSAERLAEFGAVPYYGEMKDDQRQQNVDRFQTDPECKVFCGQSHTGGLGITLTAATVEIYLANSFSYLDRAQSEDRAHRIGQKNNVDIIDILTKGTIDEYLFRCLQDKKDIAMVITGDNLKEMMGNA